MQEKLRTSRPLVRFSILCHILGLYATRTEQEAHYGQQKQSV